MYFQDLELELRGARPEARDELVAGLTEWLRTVEVGPRPRARLAFAAALTVATTAVFGAFGGIGHAAAAAKAVGKALAAPASPAAPQAQGGGGGQGGGGSAGQGDSVGASQYEGKTTICHRTTSPKNPYVMITISNRAIPAHQQHSDPPRPPDIIPAPPTGCPTTAS